MTNIVSCLFEFKKIIKSKKLENMFEKVNFVNLSLCLHFLILGEIFSLKCVIAPGISIQYQHIWYNKSCQTTSSVEVLNVNSKILDWFVLPRRLNDLRRIGQQLFRLIENDCNCNQLKTWISLLLDYRKNYKSCKHYLALETVQQMNSSFIHFKFRYDF